MWPRLGQRGVKRRVEAGDGRHAGKRVAHRAQRRQRLRLVQGREIDELAQRVLDRAVDPHRLPEALAAVDDPVPDRVGLAQPGLERGFEAAGSSSDRGAASSRSASGVSPSPSSEA